VAAEQEFIDGGADLAGAGVRANTSNAGSETRERHSLDYARDWLTRKRPRRKDTVLDEEDDGAGGHIGVDGLAKDHRDPHGGSRDYEREGWVVRVNDFGGSDDQFAVVTGANQLLQTLLHLPAKPLRIYGINPTVHEPEAVGGADQRITVRVKNRSAMDADAVNVTAEALPGSHQWLIDSGKDDPHGRSSCSS
jgi:hypothetical protein